MGALHRFDLEQIRYRTHLNKFVETGTLYGDGIDFALKSGFEDIYSIEIDKRLYDDAVKKYKNKKNVNLYVGDSATILPTIIENINEPALFWLDALFPGVDAGHMKHDSSMLRSVNIPLEYELEILCQRKQPDIIICSNMWLYEDWKTSTGTFDQHCRNHNQHISRDALKVNDTLIEKFELMFEDTHKITKHYIDQGYFTLIPA